MDSQIVDRDCIAVETPSPPDAAAGRQSRPRRHLWLHFSKMGACADAAIPRTWLSGGEVVLTTGNQLPDARRARDYVVRLVEHRIASLGLGSNPPEVASHREVDSFVLLLSLQDDEALRACCDGVLAAVQAYADELLRSLDAFLEHDGHWQLAAEQALCHRHTLRYRIRRVEQLSGRDLPNPRDRIELWLALRARELAL